MKSWILVALCVLGLCGCLSTGQRALLLGSLERAQVAMESAREDLRAIQAAREAVEEEIRLLREAEGVSPAPEEAEELNAFEAWAARLERELAAAQARVDALQRVLSGENVSE